VASTPQRSTIHDKAVELQNWEPMDPSEARDAWRALAEEALTVIHRLEDQAYDAWEVGMGEDI